MIYNRANGIRVLSTTLNLTKRETKKTNYLFASLHKFCFCRCNYTFAAQHIRVWLFCVQWNVWLFLVILFVCLFFNSHFCSLHTYTSTDYYSLLFPQNDRNSNGIYRKMTIYTRISNTLFSAHSKVCMRLFTASAAVTSLIESEYNAGDVIVLALWLYVML